MHGMESVDEYGIPAGLVVVAQGLFSPQLSNIYLSLYPNSNTPLFCFLFENIPLENRSYRDNQTSGN